MWRERSGISKDKLLGVGTGGFEEVEFCIGNKMGKSVFKSVSKKSSATYSDVDSASHAMHYASGDVSFHEGRDLVRGI
jgi:hypothetical protein